MKNLIFLFIILAVIALSCPHNLQAATETVYVPLTLDYPFIRMVIMDQLYTQPGGRAVVVDKKKGWNCAYIEMSNPEVRSNGSFIIIGSNIRVMEGVWVFGKCFEMVNWEGYIEASQRIVLDESASQLHLETVDSHAYDTDRQPTVIASTMWDLIKTHIHPYFSKVVIDLTLPVNEIRTMLPLFFAADQRAGVEGWMNSLKLGGLRVGNDAVRLDLAMTVETNPSTPSEPARELTAQEIERISRIWETWDAFLVYQIESLIGETLTPEEQQTLFETLLDSRYGFVRALEDKVIGNDLIRQQFVWTWQQLNSILRSHLAKKAGHGDPIKYLAFFTASDALSALDKLGPTLNLEISRDGLLRLVQLIGTQEVTLDYSPAVDTNLRNLLGFNHPIDETGPSYEELEIPFPSDENPDTALDAISGSILRFLITPAYAAESSPPNLEELKAWIYNENDLAPYLDRVRLVLEKAADEALSKSKLDPSYKPVYRLMLMATAWQESCWRQILKSKGKLRPLFSYTQSSVGLMQINERVWRGMYKIDSLRWNIEYNARAGAEILDHYLKDYALKKMDPANPLDPDTLARAAYAMYNGGPGQFKEFLKRNKANSFYESDKLFWDKYSMAKAGEFEKVSICLVGK